MESGQEITSRPLQHLDYFMEWGGKAWQRLMAHAFQDFIGTDLHDQLILEIGTRYGKMACLFALLGAKVVGLDMNKKSLGIAREEATELNVADMILFVRSGGDLAPVSANAFDMVFSKSVLVLVPDLVRFLEEVKEKLKPGGKVVFLENAKGPWWMHLLRTFRHEKWDYTKARYFTSHEIQTVSEVFDDFVVRSWAFPPIVLIMARKPHSDNQT
ncbi:class I SAM-dependent methyltransferase [Nitrospira sp. BLG_1]|uniref:class I SAM-dependent methyltransferase n=1 Tax=Nitrospira sp. BLG_1 TaxID=3395883 RepID=UPI0039BC5F1E